MAENAGIEAILLPLGVFVLFLFLLGFINSRYRRRRDEALAAIALELGCRVVPWEGAPSRSTPDAASMSEERLRTAFTTGYKPRRLEHGVPRIEGRVRRRDVAIEYVRGPKQTDTRVTVGLRPMGVTVGVNRRSFVSKLGTALGMGEVETDDPTMREAYVVSSKDAALVRRIFSGKVPQSLMALAPLFRASDALYIVDDLLVFQRFEATHDRDVVVPLVHQLLEIAVALEEQDRGTEGTARRE